ncbi:hypothetical protein EJ08DRAFT_410775 [Tothia fuscella]|uniref:Uncharacterized protein n=1 Tax=Tothia fuscella TaxID=1048955 RepID=A0A9P4NKB8_9PEZI|nr:hypothetical protein EJ08DRAFT_410775 [Tothia fuscella]
MASTASSESLLSPHDVIFSCSICQATITEIYAKPEGDQGFNSHSDGTDQERVVTKLWLTECSHLTCTAHLEGGGVPFHPEGEKPKAPCPLCVAERADNSPKLLFGITGFGKGEHDADVPAEYFEMPPEKLGGASPGSCAMRFQYLALLRYGITMHKKCADARKAASESERKTKKLARAAQDYKDEAKGLREQLQSLESVKKEYANWKKREPEVRHYLKSFAAIARLTQSRENDLLKKQLTSLGYEVPRTNWSMNAPSGRAKPSEAKVDTTEHGLRQPTDQSRGNHRSSSSSRKRTHQDYLGDDAGAHQGEVMMPPPLPQQPHQGRQVERHEQICPEQVWQPALTPLRPRREPPLSRRADPYMMSGALPLAKPAARQPLRPESIRHNLSHLIPPSRGQSFLPPRTVIQDFPPYVNRAREPPLPTVSHSSDPRQHTMIPQSRAGHHLTDSGYYSNAALRQPQEQLYIPNPFTTAADRQIFQAPVEASPFFSRSRNVIETPLRQQSRRIQAEEIISGARNFRMQPVASRSPVGQVGHSLNSLSFINSPYTNSNHRILDPRARPDTAQQPIYSPQYLSRSNIAQSQQFLRRAPDSRLPSAAPQTRRTFTRDDDIRLLNTIRGAKSGVPVEREYGRRVGGLPFARNSSTASRLVSAGGRRGFGR